MATKMIYYEKIVNKQNMSQAGSNKKYKKPGKKNVI